MVTTIEQRYIDQHPKCATRFSRARNIFPNGVTHESRNMTPFPFYASHGLGPHKWDIDGQKIIDYKVGHGSLLLGHSHPEIVSAVTDQMSKATHLSASTDLEIAWGTWVQELVPCSEKVRFFSSGTEADMMAMRMARVYTDRSKIIKFEDHFHGWSDYAVAGGTNAAGIPRGILESIIVLPRNDISKVEEIISTGDVAGVILEPTGAHMGKIPIFPTFLHELREITKNYGTILIFDEVVTGFRTSRGGAQELYGVIPDISTHAKILGGGLPGGAVTGKAEILDTLQITEDSDFNNNDRITHYGTYNANPLSAAAGIKALELVATQPLNDRANEMALKLKNGLNDLLIRNEVPGCASGVAAILEVRIGVDHECDKEVCNLSTEDLHKISNSERSRQFALSMYSKGVDVMDRYMLSATHDEQDIDHTLDAFESSIKELRSQNVL